MKISVQNCFSPIVICFFLLAVIYPQVSFSGNLTEDSKEKNSSTTLSDDEEDNLQLTLFGTLYSEQNNRDEMSVKLFDLNSSTTIELDKTSNFKIYLDFDKEYEVEFSQKGFITKTIIVDTSIPDDISKDFPPFNISVTLLKDDSNSDIAPLTAGKIYYSAELDNFTAMILTSPPAITEEN